VLPSQISRSAPIGTQPQRQMFHNEIHQPARGHSAGPRRVDRAIFSPDAVALARLARIWGSLSYLFGTKGKGKGPPLLDLSAMRAAMAEAQRNAQVMQERNNVIRMLKSSALEQAEKLVENYYGLMGDGVNIRIKLEEDMGGSLAAVSYTYDRNGRMADISLHLNMRQFLPDASSNGINGKVIENDRTIAHELTHAVMGRNMDIRYIPDWFMEGTAEYIGGAAERLALTLRQLTPRALMARLAHPWQGDTTQYAASYLAVRYLDQATAANGGLREIMQRLKAGDSLDQAIQGASAGQFASTADFVVQFVRGGIGEAFLRTIDLSGRDAGSIKPGRGPDVVSDHGTYSHQPLTGFRVQWPRPLEGIRLSPAHSLFGPQTIQSAAASYARHQGQS